MAGSTARVDAHSSTHIQTTANARLPLGEKPSVPQTGPSSCATPMYRTLAAEKLHATVQRLELRIVERFPDSSLGKLAGEVSQVSLEAQARIERMRRPILLLRVLVLVLIVGLGSLLVFAPILMRAGEISTLLDLVQVVEPALGTAFFIGAFVLFLVSLELRIKRGRVVQAVHELRALAHIVDMHQLTKDPSPVRGGATTASSPSRDLTPFQLGRYFDYCCELLSLISKLGALYVQDLRDAETTNAIDDLEDLCTGLARKIWQKAMLLDREG